MTDPRSALPSVDRLVQLVAEERFALNIGHPILVGCAREVISAARDNGGAPPDDGWSGAMQRHVERALAPTLVRTINATGVILHTNLGRAPLADEAIRAIAEIAGYNTLEYDLEQGERSSRQNHVRTLLQRLTGAEDAIVTNNAAAALTLLLNTVSRNAETIVSRGELVEIGDAFRIPDILERSGCILVEVGATNRTRLRDYEAALSPRTRAALKVHRSNFAQSGFTSEVDLNDLVGFMSSRNVTPVHDAGSGLLIDLGRFGLTGEPVVPQSVATGATVVFSGDKLLGGPQAGIIAGPSSVVDRVQRNPLARALRPDKIVLATLEATLRLYLDPEGALTRVPVLRMLVADPDDLATRAATLASRIDGATTAPDSSSPGGGSFPGCELPTTVVVVPTEAPDQLLTRLRDARPHPIIARAAADGVRLDPRTLRNDEFDAVATAVRDAR